MLAGVADGRERADLDRGQQEVSSGHPQVDDAVRSLDALDDLPVAEHVAVYQTADALLRGALDDAGTS
jgi:hypothetical protein